MKEESKLFSMWSDRISTARKWRDSICESEGWERFIDEYDGKFKITLGRIPVPPINDVYSYVQTALSYLSARNPYIAVNPKRTGDIRGAFILEAAINYFWKELNIKDENELSCMDAILVGHGWNKTGVNVKLSGSGDQLRIDQDQLFSNRVSWRDMLFNINSKRPTKDSMWMAHRIMRPLEDIKKDYGAGALRMVGAPHPTLDEKIRKDMLYKDDIQMGALWEIWDAFEKKVYLIPDENTGKFLEDPRPWPDYLENFPYQFLTFANRPDKSYPDSEIKPWEPQLLEKIKVFTQALNHIKRWNRTMLSKKGAMLDADKQKFELGIDGTILEVNGDPQNMTKMVDYGSLPPDIYMILDRLDNIIQVTNRTPEFMKGGVVKSPTRTLGELEMRQSGARSSVDRKQSIFEKFQEDIARQLIAHMKNHFYLPTAVKITGNEPAEIIAAFANEGRYDPASRTIMFSAEDIKGEYDVSVKAGSTLPLDKMTRDAILDRVLELAIPLAQAPTLPPFIVEIITERLRDFDMKGLEDSFQRQIKDTVTKEASGIEAQQAQVKKTAAEADKREAQASQIKVDTFIKSAAASAKAAGIIPLEAKV